MGRSCVALCCRAYKADGRSYHKFPFTRPDLLKKWIRAVNREDWYPNRNSVLCSKHFTKDCYPCLTGYSFARLNDDAVPTIFGKPIQPPPLPLFLTKAAFRSQPETSSTSQKNETILCTTSENLLPIKLEKQPETLTKDQKQENILSETSEDCDPLELAEEQPETSSKGQQKEMILCKTSEGLVPIKSAEFDVVEHHKEGMTIETRNLELPRVMMSRLREVPDEIRTNKKLIQNMADLETSSTYINLKREELSADDVTAEQNTCSTQVSSAQHSAQQADNMTFSERSGPSEAVTPRPFKRAKPLTSTDEILVTVSQRLEEAAKEDQFDVYGKHVAQKLRLLNPEQRIFAQKLMNDALFEAEIGSLHRNASINTGFTIKCEPPSNLSEYSFQS